MSGNFSPVEEPELYCRHCDKVQPAILDRSIAENGRVVDHNSTFEYYCTKCFKTVCFCGSDLFEQRKDRSEKSTREYSPDKHFLVGETIVHKKFKESGKVVGKDNGTPSKIIVKFEKSGIKKLIQDIA